MKNFIGNKNYKIPILNIIYYTINKKVIYIEKMKNILNKKNVFFQNFRKLFQRYVSFLNY